MGGKEIEMVVSKLHIKKNDLVMVTEGKEKGKSGRVLKVVPEKKKVIIEKINFIKRHTRPHGQQRRGGFWRKRLRFIFPMSCSSVRNATSRSASDTGWSKETRRPGSARNVEKVLKNR